MSGELNHLASAITPPRLLKSRGMPLIRALATVSLVLGSLLTSGCNYFVWPESFGDVTPPNSIQSLNGLGVHKRMWETAGARVLTPQKLSPRLDDFDVLVLVGKTYGPPGRLARDWLENWLREGEGRSVVYFGRDFDANLLYRNQTLEELNPADQLLSKNFVALREADLFADRLAHFPEDVFCRWFFVKASSRPTVHQSFTGPWSPALSGLAGGWPVRTILQPPESDLQLKKPSWISGASKKKLVPVRKFQLGDDSEQVLGDKEVQRSVWVPEEIDTDELWQEEWDLAGSPEVLLAGSGGEPLVFRISSPDFPDGQILIVANGAPFLNGNMVLPLHRKIGEMVIEECLPAKRVGLVSYGENGLLISQIDAGGKSNVGMELLTVWPMSAITMHAAFLGIVVCFVLLPILGRPQKLSPRSVTDFGLHVEAVGQMLLETRDIRYAVTMIRDYFCKVRKENPPEWLGDLAEVEFDRTPVARRSESGDATPVAGSSLSPEDVGATAFSPYLPPLPDLNAPPASPTNKPPVDPLS
jgi:hypothetical protein